VGGIGWLGAVGHVVVGEGGGVQFWRPGAAIWKQGRPAPGGRGVAGTKTALAWGWGGVVEGVGVGVVWCGRVFGNVFGGSRGRRRRL
jgi:hypothetical protein